MSSDTTSALVGVLLALLLIGAHATTELPVRPFDIDEIHLLTDVFPVERGLFLEHRIDQGSEEGGFVVRLVDLDNPNLGWRIEETSGRPTLSLWDDLLLLRDGDTTRALDLDGGGQRWQVADYARENGLWDDGDTYRPFSRLGLSGPVGIETHHVRRPHTPFVLGRDRFSGEANWAAETVGDILWQGDIWVAQSHVVVAGTRTLRVLARSDGTEVFSTALSGRACYLGDEVYFFSDEGTLGRYRFGDGEASFFNTTASSLLSTGDGSVGQLDRACATYEGDLLLSVRTREGLHLSLLNSNNDGLQWSELAAECTRLVMPGNVTFPTVAPTSGAVDRFLPINCGRQVAFFDLEERTIGRWIPAPQNEHWQVVGLGDHTYLAMTPSGVFTSNALTGEVMASRRLVVADDTLGSHRIARDVLWLHNGTNVGRLSLPDLEPRDSPEMFGDVVDLAFESAPRAEPPVHDPADAEAAHSD